MTRIYYRRGSCRKRWSPQEDEIVRRLYPDYQEIQRHLKKRSYYAIRARARILRVATGRHIWTNRDITRLRSLYLQGATQAEAAAEFPHLNKNQICGKARHIRLVRARRNPYKLGISSLDTVRKQATTQGLSWRQLDKLAKTGRYFQKTIRREDWTHLARAVEKLGGTIDILWNPW